MEFIVRLALFKNRATKSAGTLEEAIDLMVGEIASEYSPLMGINFRQEHIYTLEVDDFIKKHMFYIENLFYKFTTPDKKFLSLDDCCQMLQHSSQSLDIPIYEFNRLFV